MSTKTTFKRIALVAVAALGLGVLSVAPSTAALNQDTLTLSAATATQSLSETKTATSVVATLSFLPSAQDDSIAVTASLVSGPAGNTALPLLALKETASASIDTVTAGSLVLRPVNYVVASNTAVKVNARAASTVTTAKFHVYLGVGNDGSATAPLLAGTYVVKLTPTAQGAGVLAGATAQTLTITVAAAKGPDATSTSYIVAGTGASAGADSLTVTGVKTAGTTVATIYTTQNTAAAATSAPESVTAVITGSGTLATSGTNQAGRALTAKHDDNILVKADGTSGVGTITLTGATSGLVYKTVSVTFFDSKPVTATATVKKAYPAAGKTTTSAVFVTVKDSLGNVVNDATVDLLPATTGTGETTTACAYSATYSANVCSVTGTSSLKFGPVVYKARVTGADTDETEISSAVFTLTFADVVATKVAITAPATGSVGDKVTVTLTATEKNGYPVADSTYEGTSANGTVNGIFWNTTTVPVYSSSSFAPFNSGETITTLSGIATKDLYLPAVSGTVTGAWTLAGTAGSGVTTGAIDKTISGSALSMSIAVANPGVDAATDAANEATDAANAATDAALAAADAADAATAAAQDATDAVAALSASVSKLISSLRAQITSLTNLVIKIQKKVRA
jgi:hypothetical protein